MFGVKETGPVHTQDRQYIGSGLVPELKAHHFFKLDGLAATHFNFFTTFQVNQ
jgi:hypothetical protein